ncbi:hypothetical protein [Hydrogenophaga sp. PAMC20947]|uniref:hypothetical protein n=1 Tax=Hydrogenophaga sp. PAMC20947 TaxID=2565558 RepID=UPI00109DAD25|nr:hypothetical protein [Hydrogenophaga sp. PAMC20947]QCB47701.1 hypothetical protein E5678_17685 [Hydrogenophaga sp. PAMC20947]
MDIEKSMDEAVTGLIKYHQSARHPSGHRGHHQTSWPFYGGLWRLSGLRSEAGRFTVDSGLKDGEAPPILCELNQ